jgi:predicted HicB family RNase H-like nuclease
MEFHLSAPSYSFSSPPPSLGVVELGFESNVVAPLSFVSAAAEAKSADAAESRSVRSAAAAADQPVKKLSIVLPKDVHQRAKLLALREDITLTSLIVDLLRDRINRSGG